MHDVPQFTQWFLDNAFQTPNPLVDKASSRQALILAAQQGRADVVDYLLRLGADTAVTDAYGNNALWAACYSECADCIALLLKANININYQNLTGATALTFAASSGKQAVVKQLLDANANPLLTTQDDFSALDLAANRQCLQLLRAAAKAWT
jgi:uncharacterized protein